MKIEQTKVFRWKDKDLIIELTLQTKDTLSHKALTESEELVSYVKRCLDDCGSDIKVGIIQDLDANYPDGITW